MLLKTNAPEPVGPVAFLSGAPGRIPFVSLRASSLVFLQMVSDSGKRREEEGGSGVEWDG